MIIKTSKELFLIIAESKLKEPSAMTFSIISFKPISEKCAYQFLKDSKISSLTSTPNTFNPE